MQDRLNIPKTIRVGFQKRSDTYTGSLAYVIYYNNKNILCKEKSWEGWRDKKITPIDYPNESTSGFVLNKDVGGTQRSWDWHGRREKVRVYDPRDFEFEITLENLLFILQECSAIKGKGLEGEFVYAWSGSELVLLPVGSQEHKASTNFCDLQLQKVEAKDVIPGCTYTTKNKEEVMYMGRFDWYAPRQIKEKVKEIRYGYERERTIYHTLIGAEKKHIFLRMESLNEKPKVSNYLVETGFTKLALRITNEPISQFADAYEKLANSGLVSKPVALELGTETVPTSLLNKGWGKYIAVQDGDKYYMGHVSEDWVRNRDSNGEEKKYNIECTTLVEFNDGKIIQKDKYYYDRASDSTSYYKKESLPIDAVKAVVRRLYVKCENGARYILGDN